MLPRHCEQSAWTLGDRELRVEGLEDCCHRVDVFKRKLEALILREPMASFMKSETILTIDSRAK